MNGRVAVSFELFVLDVVLVGVDSLSFDGDVPDDGVVLSFEGEVPALGVVVVVGVVVGVVLGVVLGVVGVVGVVGFWLYPEPSSAAIAADGIASAATTAIATGRFRCLRAPNDRFLVAALCACGLLEATTSVRVMPTSGPMVSGNAAALGRACFLELVGDSSRKVWSLFADDKRSPAVAQDGPR